MKNHHFFTKTERRVFKHIKTKTKTFQKYKRKTTLKTTKTI